MKLDVLVLSGCCKNPLVRDFAQSRYSSMVHEYRNMKNESEHQSIEASSYTIKPVDSSVRKESLLRDMGFASEET